MSEITRNADIESEYIQVLTQARKLHEFVDGVIFDAESLKVEGATTDFFNINTEELERLSLALSYARDPQNVDNINALLDNIENTKAKQAASLGIK